MTILALEASTASVKALLYEKKIIGEMTISYDEKVGDMKKQHVDVISDLLFECAKKLLDQHRVEVDCISISTVWSSLLILDSLMKPELLSTWADISSNEQIKIFQEDTKLWDYAYKHTGCNIHSKYPIWRYMAQTYHTNNHYIGSLAEWLYVQFTGQFVVGDILASGSGMFNLETLTWDQHLLDLAGINIHQLPKIVSHKTMYPLTKEAAKRLNIKQKIPVLIPSGDGGLNHISEMEDKNQVISLSIGTSAAIRVDVDSPLIVKDRSLWSHYLGNHRYVSGGTISGAGNLVQWFLNQLPEGYDLSLLEEGLKEVDIKSAPIFLPYIFGEQSPGWRLKTYGGFTRAFDYKNISNQEIYSMYYSILEGVSFNLKQCLDRILLADHYKRVIKVSGGVVHSEFWLQLLADVFERPIHISQQQHQSMMGAIKISRQVLAEHFSDDGVGMSYEHLKFQAIAPQANQDLYRFRYSQYIEAYRSQSI